MLPRHWREFWDVQAWGRRPQRTVHDRFLDTASDSIGRRQASELATRARSDHRPTGLSGTAVRLVVAREEARAFDETIIL
eukprot:scaffold1154_cov132-Amphora_coffeaeformis.AAC.1